MDRVFLVHHFREFEDGHDDLKLIGVYSTEASARAAIERVRKWRVFRDDPKGFLMSVHSLDRESWYGEYDDA